jgi:putative transcriptional regulator
MKTETFNELLASVREAGAVLRGARHPARVRELTAESVPVVRSKLGLSQPEFARMIGVSVGTLRNWEQGRREPTGAAKVLLRVAARYPREVLKAVNA